MARDLLATHDVGRTEVTIGRASDYFGPRGGAQSNLGDRLFPAALAGKTASVLGDPDEPHTCTFIPDIGEGLAVLGEHPESPGQVWHLPNDPGTRTTRQLVDLVYRQAGQRRVRLRALLPLLLRGLGLINPGPAGTGRDAVPVRRAAVTARSGAGLDGSAVARGVVGSPAACSPEGRRGSSESSAPLTT